MPIKPRKINQKKGARRMVGRILGKRGLAGLLGRGIRGLRSRLRLKSRRLGAHAAQASGNRAARMAKAKASNPRVSMPASLHDKNS